MKSKLKLIVLIVSTFIAVSKSFAQSVDSLALKEIQEHLNFIGKFINYNKDSGNFKFTEKPCPCSNSISFLTRLTGIPSYSNGNYGGQFPPSEAEYKRWVVWVEFYKYNLRWDKINRSIIVHREVSIN